MFTVTVRAWLSSFSGEGTNGSIVLLPEHEFKLKISHKFVSTIQDELHNTDSIEMLLFNKIMEFISDELEPLSDIYIPLPEIIYFLRLLVINYLHFEDEKKGSIYRQLIKLLVDKGRFWTQFTKQWLK